MTKDFISEQQNQKTRPEEGKAISSTTPDQITSIYTFTVDETAEMLLVNMDKTFAPDDNITKVLLKSTKNEEDEDHAMIEVWLISSIGIKISNFRFP
jgi:hypothetical protein